jgi:hypothetical protein
MFNYTDKESMELIIATIYGIWYARNLLIFQEKILPPQEISHTALSQIHEYQRLCLAAKPLNRSNSTGTRSNNISWSPPPWGALKANVDALDLLESLRISWVILESDCQSLVNTIRWKREIRKQWGSVVKRCIEFLKVNPQSDIKWVGRSGNRVAHELAKWAEKEPNIEWTRSLPCCILPYIQKDMGLVNLS